MGCGCKRRLVFTKTKKSSGIFSHIKRQKSPFFGNLHLKVTGKKIQKISKSQPRSEMRQTPPKAEIQQTPKLGQSLSVAIITGLAGCPGPHYRVHGGRQSMARRNSWGKKREGTVLGEEPYLGFCALSSKNNALTSKAYGIRCVKAAANGEVREH